MNEKRFEELFPEPEIMEKQGKRHARTFFKHWARQLSPKTPWDFAQAIQNPVKSPHKKMMSLYITMGSTVAACLILAVILPNLSALLHISEHTDTGIVTEADNEERYDDSLEESFSADSQDHEREEIITAEQDMDNLPPQEDPVQENIPVQEENNNHGGTEAEDVHQQTESGNNEKKQGKNKTNEEKQGLSQQEENEKNEKNEGNEEKRKSDQKEEKSKPGKGQSKDDNMQPDKTQPDKIRPEDTDKISIDSADNGSENDVSAESTEETENVESSVSAAGGFNADDNSAHPVVGNQNDFADTSIEEDDAEETADAMDMPSDMAAGSGCDDSSDDNDTCDSSYIYTDTNTGADTDIGANNNTDTNPDTQAPSNDTTESVQETVDSNVPQDTCVGSSVEVPLQKDVAAYSYLHLGETWYVKKGMLKPWGEETEYSYLGKGFLSEKKDFSQVKAVTVLGEEQDSFVVYVEFQNQGENAYFYYERMEE